VEQRKARAQKKQVERVDENLFFRENLFFSKKHVFIHTGTIFLTILICRVFVNPEKNGAAIDQ